MDEVVKNNNEPQSHPSVMWDNSEIAEPIDDSLLEEGELDKYKNLKDVMKLNVYNLEILEEDDDIMLVDLWLMHAGKNRNGADISKEVIEKAIPYFYNKFIIYKFDNDYLPKDVTEHNNDKFNTDMNIAGIILPQGGYRWVTKNNKEYLVMVGAISKIYQSTLVQIIKKRKGNMGVSIEIVFPKADVDKAEEDKKNGVGDGYIHLSWFKPRGVALLGKGVVEGIEGSEMNVTKFTFDAKKVDDYNERFLAFSKKKENENILLQIRKNAQKTQVDIFGRKEEQELEDTVLQKNELTTDALYNLIDDKLRPFKYHDGEWEGRKYWIQEIYPISKKVIVRDNETGRFYKFSYEIDDKDELTLDTKETVEVRKDGWREVDDEYKPFSFAFAEKDLGTGGEIKVDKSKEAMSDTPWGDIDKIELRKKVLEASNYKELVKDVYAKVLEGWETAPSENLKYPIMEIKGDKAVYNRYGLASALAYAKAEKDEEVIKKIEGLYKELDLDEKEEGQVEESKNKLDEHNPEIEKIKDDADAIEDDEKEKKSNNVIDKPEEKKLQDDVDADKDYWKSKYAEIETKYSELECALAEKEKELNEYKLAEDKISMKKILKSYSKLFSKEEIEEFACKIDNTVKEDFIKELESKVLLKAKSEDDADDDDFDDIDDEEDKDSEKEETFKYSFGMPTNPFVFVGSNKNKKPENINDVLTNLGINKK